MNVWVDLWYLIRNQSSLQVIEIGPTSPSHQPDEHISPDVLPTSDPVSVAGTSTQVLTPAKVYK